MCRCIATNENHLLADFNLRSRYSNLILSNQINYSFNLKFKLLVTGIRVSASPKRTIGRCFTSKQFFLQSLDLILETSSSTRGVSGGGPRANNYLDLILNPTNRAMLTDGGLG
ncbi:uncharacterized protein LOC143348160 [Colletes latitarsis]|uniref:uncharacterized protein LOC143348160 n=1 Tax=Colletes latitarsis TaxID=2605962 RepID=UPI0040362BF8